MDGTENVINAQVVCVVGDPRVGEKRMILWKRPRSGRKKNGDRMILLHGTKQLMRCRCFALRKCEHNSIIAEKLILLHQVINQNPIGAVDSWVGIIACEGIVEYGMFPIGRLRGIVRYKAHDNNPC